jgi:hypothetical protein
MKAARLGIGVAGALVALSIQPATALATNAQATDAPAGASVVAEATDAGVGAASASDNSAAERPVSPEVATQGAAGSGPAGEKDPASDAASDPKGSDAEAPDATEDPADATDPKGSDAGQPEVPPIADEAVFDISPELTGSATRVATQGDSGAEGTNVEGGATANVLGQYWRTVSLGGSEYRFVSLKGSSALGYDSATERANVRLVGEDSDNARWTLVRNDDGSYSLSPVADRGLRLDVSGGSRSAGANLWLYAANGTLAQRFRLGLNPTLTEALRNGRTAEEGVYTLASGVADDKVVDISCASTENGANAQIWSSNGSLAQKFVLGYAGSGLYTLETGNAGKYLDVESGGARSGTNVWQYAGNGTLSQLWYLVRSAATYTIRSAVSGLALDVSGAGRADGTNVQVWDENGSAAQRFALRRAQLVEDGTYAIQSGLYYPLVLDVADGSADDGANVQLWSTNGSAAQHFRVTLNADGTYSIVNAATGKSLDIACASRLSGANLQMYRTNGTDAQKWAILPGEGGLKIRSVASGLDLDAAGAVADRGTNVQQYYGNGTKAQLWSFKDGGWEYYRGLAAAREKIVQAVREQEGVRYWSMHSGPRGSESEGFGCAMLVCYAYNKVLGTDWYGSCWNLWGSANGNGGFGYPLEVTSDPEPGDIVMYLDYDSGWCEAASHAALYVGNGRVIGANGEGSPYERPWWGVVEETSIGAQAYGRRVRYIRYRWF